VSTNRKKLGALLAVLAITIAVASTAGAASKGSKGCLSAAPIKIGSTFPLSEGPATGGASLYKTIAGAELAYYGYVNAHCGVNHHAIQDVVLDDQYTPSETVTDVKTLVESDHVMAIAGSLGTEPALATWGYLNNHHVPQVLLATGDAYWGNCAFHPQPYCPSPMPWTEGWQPTYPAEGKAYGTYILAHMATPHIGVLYQNDAYGLNYLSGLKKGLGSHQSDIVRTEGYAVGESNAQIGARVGSLEAHGANVVVIFATPGASIAALVTETALHWSPMTLLNNVSANRVFLLAAQGAGANVNNVISTAYLKSNSQPDPTGAMALGRAIIFATGNAGLEHQWNLGDGNLVYGLAVAWTFVDALKHAGANPTRTSLMHALRTLHEAASNKNPFVYPGMVVSTSQPGRPWPMQQLKFEHWLGQTAHATGDWKTFGPIINVGH
jgi:branched-chain amino acid transport system substrate-binding protein